MNDVFSPEKVQSMLASLPDLPFATWESFYVTILSTLMALVIGLPLGVLLVVGDKDGLLPMPRWLMTTLNFLINLLRSVPFLILMIMVQPLSQLLLGTTIGTAIRVIVKGSADGVATAAKMKVPMTIQGRYALSDAPFTTPAKLSSTTKTGMLKARPKTNNVRVKNCR